MQSVNDILVNIELVKHHKKDFWLTLVQHKSCGWVVDWDTSYYECANIKKLDNRTLANITELSIETVRRYTKCCGEKYCYAGSFAVLPNETYFRLVESTKQLAPAERNGVIRTFCYFVCMAWAYQDFSRSVELIAKDLDNKISDVSRRINWLVREQFIYIKHHQVNFAGQDRHPRVYQLYIDEVPAAYIRTEWWNFHLAARETQSVESILENFKNSF